MPTVGGFSDVKATDFYADAVVWAVNHGVTNGKTATTFAPKLNCTRAEMVTFLYRLAGEPKVGADNPFSDIAAGKYYTKGVLWAFQNGITKGATATLFKPNDPCTRGQIVTFLYRDMT